MIIRPVTASFAGRLVVSGVVVVVVRVNPAESWVVADTTTKVVTDEAKPIGRYHGPDRP